MTPEFGFKRYLGPWFLSALAWWSTSITLFTADGFRGIGDGFLASFGFLLAWPVLVPAVLLHGSSPPDWLETTLENLDPGFAVDTNDALLFLFWGFFCRSEFLPQWPILAPGGNGG